MANPRSAKFGPGLAIQRDRRRKGEDRGMGDDATQFPPIFASALTIFNILCRAL